MRINFIVQQFSGCSLHRLINPIGYLQSDPIWAEKNSATMLWVGEEEHKIDCDLLIYNKFIATPPSALLEMKKNGMKIVVDIDDSWELPVWHPSYRLWIEAKNTERVIEHMKVADLVICTSLKLQEKIRKYNKNTVVIPNAFPYGYENYQPGTKVEREKMGFMYAGGSTHLKDVELLRGKFSRINTNPCIRDNAEFILAGYEVSKKKIYRTTKDLELRTQNFTEETIHGVYDTMASIFRSTGSSKILPTLDLMDYINYYDLANVALIPLVKNTWNSYKSVLKILEAATRKLPVICSEVEPYIELKDYPGIMWVDNNNWLDHIRYCIKNPQAVKDMGEQLAENIWKNYDLNIWNKVRQDIFNSLMS